MKNYSQNREQEVILSYFNGKKGTFLDVGANDGITLSNTYALATLGWQGVLIEPSPTTFQKLKFNSRFFDCQLLNVAIGTVDGPVKMWDSGTHLNKGDHGLLSTMSPADRDKWAASTEFKEIEVQCWTYQTLLNASKIKEFDFISIDAEGYDYDILRQIDLSNTSSVCVEWNSKLEEKERFDALMTGFKLIYTSGENLIYVR